MIHKFELPPSIQIEFTDPDGVTAVVDALRVDTLYHTVYRLLPDDPTDPEKDPAKRKKLVNEVEDWLEPFTDRLNRLYSVSLTQVQAYSVLAECWRQIESLKKTSAPTSTPPTTSESESSAPDPSPSSSSNSSPTNSPDSEPKTNCVTEPLPLD